MESTLPSWNITCISIKGFYLLYLAQVFSASAPLTFWARGFFVWGLPVYCRMCRSVLGLYPLSSSILPPPVVMTKAVSRRCQVSRGEQSHPRWKPLLCLISYYPQLTSTVATLKLISWKCKAVSCLRAFARIAFLCLGHSCACSLHLIL